MAYAICYAVRLGAIGLHRSLSRRWVSPHLPECFHVYPDSWDPGKPGVKPFKVASGYVDQMRSNS